MADFEIEDNIEIPTRKAVYRYNKLHELEVGQSFTFPSSRANHIAQAMSQTRKRTGKAFTQRKISEDKSRVWRVK